ncbi:hypothetical protein RYZ26_05325 [Terasakiella sp. A23]|uniref:hypothetical protein n=1 Tax=Terasakiella sp. FCG-A23 TaxID=3080561 RepID=UPI002955D88A|nr:hypothetical protein [Terasakiella sp. A23]MDV7339001.1 hypothetical protein [Terasakiella sp. A23]
MDIAERRALLETQANPNKTMDYIVTLKASGPTQQSVNFRYIPDKVILSSDVFAAYITTVLSQDNNLETSATTILEDMNNELVPRWLQVIMTNQDGNGAEHHVTIEDHQPQWKNDSLLARLSKL